MCEFLSHSCFNKQLYATKSYRWNRDSKQQRLFYSKQLNNGAVALCASLFFLDQDSICISLSAASDSWHLSFASGKSGKRVYQRCCPFVGCKCVHAVIPQCMCTVNFFTTFMMEPGSKNGFKMLSVNESRRKLLNSVVRVILCRAHTGGKPKTF